MATMAVGNYQTACEASPHKQQIDSWLNDGKPSEWISRELKKQFGESITGRSVTKYKKYREEWVQKQLEQDPVYNAKIKTINEQVNDGIGKIRQVDTIGKLADIIDDSADMLAIAKQNDIQIKSAQDFKFVASTMLDAIKLYGDTVLKAQRFNAVEQDPSLLRPTTININVKNALKDVLSEVMQSGNYNMIDRLRAGTMHTVQDIEEDEDIGGDE